MSAMMERMTFGLTPGLQDLRSAQAQKAWLTQQLHPTREDPELESSLGSAVLRISYGAGPSIPPANVPDYPAVNENRRLECLGKATDQLWTLTDNSRKFAYEERIRPLREVAASKLMHARYSRWQLRELMLDFWHNHFNVHAGEPQVAVAMPEFDRDLRRMALGNFAELLERVSQSTPMLIYLNNRNSRTGAPNENFARELFELHTMGRSSYLNELYSRWKEVPGALQGKPSGYIDQDVYEAARAFTGWMIEDGRGMATGVSLPATGRFHYAESWHDPYQKRVLAQELDPFQPAMTDGKRVLGMLADHPATAGFICEKLCRRFVDDHPPRELVDSAARVWTANVKSPDQIAQVLEHILGSEDVKKGIEVGRYKKLKRPLELAMSFMRKLDLELAPSQGLVNQLSNAGQKLYLWPTPDGHPDISNYWLSAQSMRQRWFIPVGIIDNWWGTGLVSQDKVLQGSGNAPTQQGVMQTLASKLLGGAAQGVLKTIVTEQHPADTGLFSPAQDDWAAVKKAATYLAMSPQFQWK